VASGKVMKSYYSLDFEKDLAILSFIWVKPEERRQGVGRRLFRQALDEARKHGCRFLIVTDPNFDEVSGGFWRKMMEEFGGKVGDFDIIFEVR